MDRAPDRKSPELKMVVEELREKPVKVIVISLEGQAEEGKDIASGDNLVVIPTDGDSNNRLTSLPFSIDEGRYSTPSDYFM